MKEILSTSDVAKLLGVAVASVSNWIDQGKIKAGRTPGGHRRILRKDLVAFLRRQRLPIPESLLPNKPKVLIVDDDEKISKWISQEILAAYPECEVLQAFDGFSAGEIIGCERPDVVVLDIRLPGIDGFEVCRRIKARPETSHVEVIAITAYPSPKAEKEMLECGARAYLPKPLELDQLLLELQSCL